MIGKLRACLKEREALTSDLNAEVEDAEYPLRQLALYFAGDSTSFLNQKSSYIFAFYLRHQLSKLRDVASEIDEEYESDVPT
jgi:hypothetical protein